MNADEQLIEDCFQRVLLDAMASGLLLVEAHLHPGVMRRAAEAAASARYGFSLCWSLGQVRLSLDIRLTGRPREVSLGLEDGLGSLAATTSVDLLIVRWRAIVDELLVEQQRKARDLEAALSNMRRRIAPPKEDGGA